jgi:hypothetical protein
MQEINALMDQLMKEVGEFQRDRDTTYASD